jgi:tRNA(Ile2) C34 agmatinyltransferase TiaS
MLYGEHLCAEDVPLKCACGITATVHVIDKHGRSHGWHCRNCSYRVREEVRQLEKLAKAIVTGKGLR